LPTCVYCCFRVTKHYNNIHKIHYNNINYVSPIIIIIIIIITILLQYIIVLLACLVSRRPVSWVSGRIIRGNFFHHHLETADSIRARQWRHVVYHLFSGRVGERDAVGAIMHWKHRVFPLSVDYRKISTLIKSIGGARIRYDNIISYYYGKIIPTIIAVLT